MSCCNNMEFISLSHPLRKVRVILQLPTRGIGMTWRTKPCPKTSRKRAFSQPAIVAGVVVLVRARRLSWTERVSIRLGPSQRAAGTVLKADELHAAERFQRDVDLRRRPIETARRVVIASVGERVALGTFAHEYTIISSVDGASLPVSLPAASRAVYCHACHQVCQLLPLETVRTCPCTACCFCSSCRIAPRDHDCEEALQLATAVLQKLTQSSVWPFVSIVSPEGIVSLPVTVSSAFVGGLVFFDLQSHAL
eukprot:7388805-Prymnesium_polylepis.1